MRIRWNGTIVDHTTLVFYDEIFALGDPVFPLGDPRIQTAGALDCIQAFWFNPKWYLADGTRMEDTYHPHRIFTYSIRRIRPLIYARLLRKLKLYPRDMNQNGLWSCRPELSDNTTVPDLVVGVYERNWARRKLDGGLGTDTHSN